MTTKLDLEYRAPSHMAEALSPDLVVVPTDLVGTWHNVDKSTRDLVRIVISASGSSITVNPYGACVPNPCNWGAAPGTVYAPNVSSSKAEAFSANFTFGFAKVEVVGHLHKHELLVETFTIFTDGSGRSNLYTSDTMVK
ncbi:MAG: hypothetical protein ABSB60_01565 [Terracidiphilus sp.]|jgi:hypothetical protein